MQHMLKGAGFSITIFATLSVVQPVPAAAQASVLCVNCSTTMTQLLEYAKQLQQMETQLQQYSTQLQQYANMVQNTVSLPQQIYSTAMSDMQHVQGLMTMGSQLSFNNPGNSIGTFSSFLNNATSLPGNLPAQATQYAAWSTRAKDGITSAMQSIGVQNNQLSTDDQTMQRLQAQAGSSTGQMQAIQNASEISAQSVRETEKLRQLMMVQIQLQANQQSIKSEQDSQSQAEWQKFVAVNPLNDAGQRY
jgi:P-type conjugative transfer protein TrbJ